MLRRLPRLYPLCLSFCKKHIHLLLSLFWITAIALAYALPFPALRISAAVFLALFVLCGIGRLFKRFYTVFILLPLLLGLALSLVCVHRLPSETLSAYKGKQGFAVVTLTDILEQTDSLLTAEATLSSLGEKELSATVLLRLQASEDFTEGDTLRVYVSELSSVSDAYAAEGYDGSIWAVRGTKIGERHTLRSVLAHYNSLLSSSLQKRIDQEEGAFLSALLLGDKSGISASLSRDMARNGTSHILALSGLHVSLFMSGVTFLLRPLHKKARTVLSLLLIAAYVLLTGASPSALRAGFMCFCALLSFLVGRRHNSLFSLFASVSLIFAFEPYCVYGLSLWLSALATLGILLYFERKKEKTHKEVTAPKRLWRRALSFLKEYIILSAVITAAASLMVLPLSARIFGTLSLLSIPANLLLAPLSNLLLYGAFLVLPLGFFKPLSFLLEKATSLFLFLSARLADIPHTQISFSNFISLLAATLIPLAILLYCVFVPRKRFRRKTVLSLCLALCVTLSAVHVGDFLLHKNGVRLDFAANTSAAYDAVCLRESTKTFLIDGSTFTAQSAKHALSLAKACARQEIDAYVITCYDDSTASLLRSLSEENTIREVYLPAPITTEEKLSARALLEDITLDGTKATFYREGEEIALGRTTFSLLFRIPQAEAATAAAYTLEIGKSKVLCASAASLASGAAYQRLIYHLADCDTLLLGSYGKEDAVLPLPSSAFEKDVLCAADAALGKNTALSVTERGKRRFFAPIMQGPLFSP